MHNQIKIACNQMKRVHNQMKSVHNRMKRVHIADCGTNLFCAKGSIDVPLWKAVTALCVKPMGLYYVVFSLLYTFSYLAMYSFHGVIPL